ncbi:tetraacyldisaccharide 4'-kinase [Neptunomonas japonica]|uniref:tetraacyldisaccharide 4'-kinase n=1 Tax=Neptunomonas japonica TaxID=417574 RepID=UPI0003FC445F|nr:tetraacyldisaccharide 4'-kinase [Neptunomonas japonica]
MSLLEKAWYDGSRWPVLLYPLEKLFIAVSRYRRHKYELTQWRAPVPVIVVGNVNVGGTGKSPLVIALIKLLREQGYKPGVVSRGYTANPPEYPFSVLPDSTSQDVGDEPLMIVQRTQVPMVIDPDRVNACQQLLKVHTCDIIISDDGLQHYAMGRDIEIVVVDGKRGLGNGHCLPVGPLRERPSRLKQVDMIVINGEGGFSHEPSISMHLLATMLVGLNDGHCYDISALKATNVHAVAGIGNPSRFYDTLKKEGFDPIKHSFPDHHLFQEADITFDDGLPVIMTEKDAVKCRGLKIENPAYYLQVDAQLPDAFAHQLKEKLKLHKESDING